MSLLLMSDIDMPRPGPRDTPKTIDDLYRELLDRDTNIRNHLHNIAQFQQKTIVDEITNLEQKTEALDRDIKKLSGKISDASIQEIANLAAKKALESVGLEDKKAIFDMHDLRLFIQDIPKLKKDILGSVGLGDDNAKEEVGKLLRFIRAISTAQSKIWLIIVVAATMSIISAVSFDWTK